MVRPNQSGKWFNSVQYGVRKSDSLIDIDEVRELAIKHNPKLIIAGGSAYPRHINFKDFREIADLVGAPTKSAISLKSLKFICLG